MNPTTVPPAAAPDPDRARFYAADAAWYVKQLPLEHFMESVAQNTQCRITEASFDAIHQTRPDIQCFGELLIQYPIPGKRLPGRVVPDHFVVVHPEPLALDGSFPIELIPARPLFVLEYVSKGNPRKDYDGNLALYEQALAVPYYLLFYPDNEELTLFRLADGKYVAAHPGDSERYAVPELELEVALVDGWVRYWFRGELVAIPAEWSASMAAERAARVAAEQRASEAEQRAAAAERERDAERAARATLEAELARLRAAQGGA
ncbi:Uma2 family endonuclease [bacterium]|nr:Uma2 family endonuclease [bacterium]